MTYTVKGFMQLERFINNTRDANNRGVVSPVGELSDHALTYARTKEIYSNDVTNAGQDLYIFDVQRDEVQATIPADVPSLVHNMVTAMETYDIGLSFADQLANDFGTASKIETGTLVLHGGYHTPQWFSFTIASGIEPVNIKIWLADELFRQQYDSFEIIVVPPHEPVGDLYGPYLSVKPRIEAFNYLELLERIETARDRAPQTGQRGYTLRWVDPADSTKTLTTNWTILGYGPAADKYPNVLRAIRDYLTANTPYTIDQWRLYLPDILSIDTVSIIPLWDQPAVSNGVDQPDAIYTPTIRWNAAVDLAAQIMQDQPHEDIRESLETTAMVYKSIGLITVGSAANTEGKRVLTELFPDYTVISTNDQNIHRLRQTTREFIQRLELLVRQAEIDTGSNDLPSWATRSSFGGITWLETTLDNVIYRIPSRETYGVLRPPKAPGNAESVPGDS